MNENISKLYEMGWKFIYDESHPRNTPYSNKSIGWWVKDGHPKKGNLAGDSQPCWQAAKTIFDYFL